MIASMVNFSTSITLRFGSVAYPIQSMFDALMPKLLPLGLTFGCYYMMKKGVRTTWIMLGLIVAAILLVFVEGLPFFAA